MAVVALCCGPNSCRCTKGNFCSVRGFMDMFGRRIPLSCDCRGCRPCRRRKRRAVKAAEKAARRSS